MNLSKVLVGVVFSLSTVCASAGGDPEFVQYPEGYQVSFSNYITMNRVGKELVAVMYANDVAVSSYEKGEPAASGSIVIMEVYKPMKDEAGKAIMDSDGLYEIDSLAAVAVMENRDSWDEAFPLEHRVGNWGFAMYDADGKAKANDLNCAECHTPLSQQDYLYSYQHLLDFVKP